MQQLGLNLILHPAKTWLCNVHVCNVIREVKKIMKVDWQ